MKIIKIFTKLLLSCVIIVASFCVNELPVKADFIGKGYAVLTDEGDLIFFRSEIDYANLYDGEVEDINGSKYSGTVFNNVEAGGHGWSNYDSNVFKVYVADNNTIYPMNMKNWFSNCTSLTSADLRGFNTSKVTSMSGMFFWCLQLTNVNLNGLDTSNVTDMGSMFSMCRTLTSLDLSNFDTHKVRNMGGMFDGCSSLPSLDISNFDTSNVTDMQGMFGGCSSLTSLDLSSFITNSVTDMGGMFCYCNSLTSLDLSNFDTSNVTNMQSMFYGWSSLTSLDLSSFDTSNVTTMERMFYNCNSLTSLDLSSFDTSNVTSMICMFEACSSLTSLDLSNFDTSNVTDMEGMFYGCSSLKSLDLSSFNTAKANMRDMFEGCYNLQKIKLGTGFTKWASDGCLPTGTWTNGEISKTETELCEEYPSHANEWAGMWYKGTEPIQPVLVTNVSLDRTSIQINNGETAQLVVTVLPDNADNKAVSWSSSNTSVATVDQNGLVKGISSGTTVITATAKDGSGKYAQCSVTVLQPSTVIYVTSVKLNLSSAQIDKGSTLQLTASVLPTDASNKTLVWTSSNNGVVTVNQNGLVTAISSGKATIIATTTDGSNLSAVCDIVVSQSTVDPLSGTAYVVLTNTGDFIFFRSNNAYSSRQYTTVTDINGRQYTGTVFVNVENGEIADWLPDGGGDAGPSCIDYYVKRVYVSDNTVIKPLSMMWWFSGFNDLESFDSIGIDTSRVTNMDTLFGHCYSLANLDLSNFDTSNVTNMQFMFASCSALNNLDLSSFNTSNVVAMEGMFASCNSLTDLDLSNFDTRKVRNMGEMFWNCSSLTSLDLSSFDTRNIEIWEQFLVTTGMISMFDDCDSLTEIKLGRGFTKWVNEAYLPYGNWKNGSLTKTEIELYEQYPSHASSWAGTWIREARTVDPSSGYAYAILTQEGDLIFLRSNTLYSDYAYITVTDIHGQQYTGVIIPGVENGNHVWNSSIDAASLIKRVYVADNTIIYLSTMHEWFYECSNLYSFDGEGFDTSNVTDMSYMFLGCSNLNGINLTKINTRNVKDMSYMFYECGNLRSIDLSGFDTHNVTNMNMMFADCGSLDSLDLSGFDTGDVTSMFGMFCDCSSLGNLDVSSFNTTKVGEMALMFSGCSSLTSLDLSNFNTRSVYSMGSMFYNCKSLAFLDLSSFDTRNVLSLEEGGGTDVPHLCGMVYMFKGCDSLSEVKLSNRFEKWCDDAFLPNGNWIHDSLKKTERELYKEYPSHASSWTGTWRLENSQVVLRIAGTNRFSTSQFIATMCDQVVPGSTWYVILANGDNFADALAGSYLASYYGAPIIITRPGKETEVNNYIKSILGYNGTIFVLGGTAAVPESCLKGLTGNGYTIKRIAGNNRYLTNLEILNAAPLSEYNDTLLIATGTNYADSLSASATGLPMLLVKDSLTVEQRQFLRQHPGLNLVILGGTNAVNSTIESQLKAYGTVSRVSGANRAGTSIEIAKKFFPDSKTAVVAYSHNFPDGLCGGPLAKRYDAPLILTRDNDRDTTAAYLKSKGINTGYVLGGKSVISDSLIKKLFTLKSSSQIIEFKQ